MKNVWNLAQSHNLNVFFSVGVKWLYLHSCPLTSFSFMFQSTPVWSPLTLAHHCLTDGKLKPYQTFTTALTASSNSHPDITPRSTQTTPTCTNKHTSPRCELWNFPTWCLFDRHLDNRDLRLWICASTFLIRNDLLWPPFNSQRVLLAGFWSRTPCRTCLFLLQPPEPRVFVSQPDGEGRYRGREDKDDESRYRRKKKKVRRRMTLMRRMRTEKRRWLAGSGEGGEVEEEEEEGQKLTFTMLKSSTNQQLFIQAKFESNESSEIVTV